MIKESDPRLSISGGEARKIGSDSEKESFQQKVVEMLTNQQKCDIINKFTRVKGKKLCEKTRPIRSQRVTEKGNEKCY